MPEVHVVAAIIVADGMVLACRRARHKTSGGLWEFPGGKVENGELPEVALEREIREELGVGVVAGETFDVAVTQVTSDLRVRLQCILVRAQSQWAIESQDHDDYRWLTPEALKGLEWAKPDLPAVGKLASLDNFEALPQGKSNVGVEVEKQ